MRGLATMMMFAAALAGAPPLEPSRRREPEPDPLHPTGRCRCFGEGRCGWCLGARLRERDRADDLEAIAAAQAKRDRKAKKRRGGL